jgi:hypothetical protein
MLLVVASLTIVILITRGFLHAPRVDNYAPRVDNYAPRVDNYAPRVDNYAPRGYS